MNRILSFASVTLYIVVLIFMKRIVARFLLPVAGLVFTTAALRAQLTSPSQQPVVGARMPALSPDGKQLAFVYRGDMLHVYSLMGSR